METGVESRGDVVVVRVKGRLDAASAPQLEKKITSLVDAGHFQVVLDCAGVDYLSSAGMRLMLSVSKKLKHLEGRMVICSVAEGVMEVVKMAGFHQILDFCATEEEGIRALASS